MNNNFAYHLGIDLHKKTSYWTLMDNDQQLLYQKNMPTSQEGILCALREIKIEPALIQAAVEPVSQWAWYGDILKEHGMTVRLANPYKTKLIAATKLKHDKVDSKILANLLRSDFLPESYYAPKEIRELRELARWRLFLTRLRTRLKNRIHQVMAKQGISSPWSDPFGKQGRQFWMSQNLSFELRKEADHLIGFIDQLDLSIAERDKDFKERLTNYPEAKILMSIPGIGPVTTITMLSEIGDLARFNTPEKLTGFAGLNPASYSSGESTRLGRITRHGSEHLRTVLVEAAHRVRPTWGQLYEFFSRIRDKKGSKIASVALARKLLVLSWHLMRKKEMFRLIAATQDNAKR